MFADSVYYLIDDVRPNGQSRVKEFLSMEDAKFAIGTIADKICALFAGSENDASAVIPVNIKTKHLEKLFEEYKENGEYGDAMEIALLLFDYDGAKSFTSLFELLIDEEMYDEASGIAFLFINKSESRYMYKLFTHLCDSEEFERAKAIAEQLSDEGDDHYIIQLFDVFCDNSDYDSAEDIAFKFNERGDASYWKKLREIKKSRM